MINFKKYNDALFHYKLLLYRIGIIFLVYNILRILFFIFNVALFPTVSALDFIKILFYGLRFDLVAIAYLNLPIIFLHIIPVTLRDKQWYQILIKILFFFTNAVGISFALADIIYFRYTLKRTTGDIFNLGKDFSNLFTTYLADFWYLIPVLIIFLLLINLLYSQANIFISLRKKSMPADRTDSDGAAKRNFKYRLTQIIYFCLFLGLTIISIRGGLQLIPLGPGSAAKYVAAEQIPLITNTPLSILYTLDKNALEEKTFFTDGELAAIYTTHQLPDEHSKFSKENIVLIILESFSAEYMGFLNKGNGYTPFLDSLSKNSLVFKKFYANGTQSNQGIIAILGGIPSLMDDPFTVSIYQNNLFDGLGTLLKEKGYQTLFFHGAENGSLKFDDFTKAAGFDHYYGKDEYPNPADADGAWGIYDEPFFKYAAKTINKFEEPFIAGVFSLSSHHPYNLPPAYQEKYAATQGKLEKTILYTDNALKEFFKSASKMPWYNNTLFVITADHTGPTKKENGKNAILRYHIPLLLFHPTKPLAGYSDKVGQHVDIQNTILDYLNYNKAYQSFGNSLIDNTTIGCSFNYYNNIYQIINNSILVQSDGNEILGVYNYGQNPAQPEMIDMESHQPLQNKLKAIIQTYNKQMTSNQLRK